jgi:hypothetical protein
MGKLLTSLFLSGLSIFNCASNTPTPIPEGMVKLPGGYYTSEDNYPNLVILSRIYSGEAQVNVNGTTISIKNLQGNQYDQRSMELISKKADKHPRDGEISFDETIAYAKEMYSERLEP